MQSLKARRQSNISMSGSGSTAMARTNPPLSGPESSRATRWAAMNHLELNDLQIYREKATGTSRARVYLLDPTLWSVPQINLADKGIECVCWYVSGDVSALNNLSLTEDKTSKANLQLSTNVLPRLLSCSTEEEAIVQCCTPSFKKHQKSCHKMTP